VFGTLEVSNACPVLCNNCDTNDGTSNPVNTFASSGGGKSAGSTVGIVILLLLLVAAGAFIYATRVRNAEEETAGVGGSSMAAAFENPMYEEAGQGSSTMVAVMHDLHTKTFNDAAFDERSIGSTKSSASGANNETHNLEEEQFDSFADTNNGQSQGDTYECEFDCGFEGPTGASVEQHEQTCARNPVVGRSLAGGAVEESFGGFGESSDAVDAGVQMAVSGVLGAGIDL